MGWNPLPPPGRRPRPPVNLPPPSNPMGLPVPTLQPTPPRPKKPHVPRNMVTRWHRTTCEACGAPFRLEDERCSYCMTTRMPVDLVEVTTLDDPASRYVVRMRWK